MWTPRHSRKSSLASNITRHSKELRLPGNSFVTFYHNEFGFNAVVHPSVKAQDGKEVAFFDPSKVETDKTCLNYLEEGVEISEELELKNDEEHRQLNIKRGQFILTSLRNEVLLRDVLSDLVNFLEPSKKRRILKGELNETEKRARWHNTALRQLLYKAEQEERSYKARTYISYGTLLRITTIMQFNLLNKVSYPTERYHTNGCLHLLLYTAVFLLVALPIQLVIRAISQYSRSLVINSWNFCPFFKGVGWITLIIGAHCMLNTGTIIAEAFYMFIEVLRGHMGWTECDGADDEFCSSAASDYTSRVDCFNTNGAQIPMVMSSGAHYYYAVIQEAFDLKNKEIKLTGILCMLSMWALVCTLMLIGFERFIKVVEILFFPIALSGLLLLSTFLLNGQAEGINDLFEVDSIDLKLLASNNAQYITVEGRQIKVSDMYRIEHRKRMFYSITSTLAVYPFQLLPDMLINAQVANGVITFLAAHSPQKANPIVDTFLFTFIELFLHYTVTIFVFASAGFLQVHYNAIHSTCFLIDRNFTLLALIPEFLGRRPFGKYLVILFLLFLILTQIVYVVIVGFTIVKTVTELIGEGLAQMYAVFVMISTAVGLNLYYNFSLSPDSSFRQEISCALAITALVTVSFFLFAIVMSYSVSRLCKDITVINEARPRDVYQPYIKISFLIFIIMFFLDVYERVNHSAVKNWSLTIKCMGILLIPVVFSAIFKITESLSEAKFTLMQTHPDWNQRSPEKRDVDMQQYKQKLHCSHKCLKDFMYYSLLEELRSEAVRKCFLALQTVERT